MSCEQRPAEPLVESNLLPCVSETAKPMDEGESKVLLHSGCATTDMLDVTGVPQGVAETIAGVCRRAGERNQ